MNATDLCHSQQASIASNNQYMMIFYHLCKNGNAPNMAFLYSVHIFEIVL